MPEVEYYATLQKDYGPVRMLAWLVVLLVSWCRRVCRAEHDVWLGGGPDSRIGVAADDRVSFAARCW